MGGNNTRDSDYRLPSQLLRVDFDGDVWVGWLSSHKSSVDGRKVNRGIYIVDKVEGGVGCVMEAEGGRYSTKQFIEIGDEVPKISTVFRSK